MPKVSDEYRSARRAEITAAALRVIRRKGFHATSMSDIIAESGLSAGAIYGHFSSKADIVLEVARRVVGHRIHDLQRLTEAEPLTPPPQALRMLVQAMIRELVDPMILVQVWGEAVVDDRLRELTLEVFLRLREVLTAYLAAWFGHEHGLPPEPARARALEVAPLYLSAVQGLVLQRAVLPDFDETAYFAMLERELPH